MRSSEPLTWITKRAGRGATAALVVLLVGCTGAPQGTAAPTPSPGAAGSGAGAASSAPGGSTAAPPGSTAAPVATEPSSGERYLGGTFTWNAADANTGSSVSGHMELVLHDVGGHLWVSERGSGSSYTYDAQYTNCSPMGHLSGVVESGVGGQVEPEWHIGIANVLDTDVTPTADLGVAIQFYDEWDVTCPGPVATVASIPVLSFPGCTEATRVTMKNDGKGSYAVSCDVAIPNWPMTGHISGELHPIDGP